MNKLSPLPVLKIALVGCAIAAGLSALVHPAGQVKVGGDSSQPVLHEGDANAAVLAILQKSCQNCHSEQTRWPWYSYIAPMSWMIESDVSAARDNWNLTQWQSYSSARKIAILTEIVPLVRNRIMPPKRYILLHPDAKPSAQEIEQLAAWAHQQRMILKTAPTQ